MNWTYFLWHPLKPSALLHCKAAFLCDATNTVHSEAAMAGSALRLADLSTTVPAKLKWRWVFSDTRAWRNKQHIEDYWVKLTQGWKFVRNRSLIVIRSSENNQKQNVMALKNSANFHYQINKQIIESQQKNLSHHMALKHMLCIWQPVSMASQLLMRYSQIVGSVLPQPNWNTQVS